MANTLNLGNGQWATKEGSLLGYNSENNNYKPLPFDFSRASTATRVNKQGLIETVGADQPRVDYLNNTKGHLLLEPSRTNLFTYSEDFSQSFWNKASSSVTLTSQIAPNGTSNSVYNLVGTSANLYAGGVTGVQHTLSFYIKSNNQGKDKFKLRLGNNTSVEYTATNEWVRYEYTETPTTNVFGITTTSAPNNEFDLLVWGGQSEQGSYATSYIPTSGSAVTRLADVCNNGGNDQVINSTEGVLYAEISALADDLSSRIISLSDGTDTNRVNLFYFSQSNDLAVNYRVSGSTVVSFIADLTDITNFSKVAFKWESGNFKMYVDGTLIDEDTNTTMLPSDTLDVLSFSRGDGSFGFYGNVKDVRVYNTALTDQELQNLTS